MFRSSRWMAILSGLQLVEAMHADPRLAVIPVIMMVDVFDAPTEPLPPGLVVVPKPLVMPHLLGLVAEGMSNRAIGA